MTAPAELDSTFSAARRIARIAVPVVGSGLVTLFVSANDTVLLGRSGADAVAAASAARSIQFVALLFVSGLTIPAQIMVARRTGAKDAEGAARAAGSMLALSLRFAAAITVGLALTGPWLLDIVLAGSDVPRDLATRYLWILLLALPLLAVGATLRGFAIGLGRSRIVLPATVASAVVDVGLALSLLALGVGPLGVAVATVAGIGVSTGILALWTARVARQGVPTPGVRHLLRGDELRPVWQMGWPEAVQSACSAGASVVVTVLLAPSGVVTLAAARTLDIAVNMAWTVLYALGTAVTTVAAQRLGAHDQAGYTRACRAATMLTFGTAGLAVLAFAPVTVTLLGLAVDDPRVAVEAQPVVLVAWLQVLWMAAVVTTNALLRAHGDTRTPLRASLAGEYLVFLPLGWILCRILDLGLPGIFITHHVFWATYFAVGIWSLRRKHASPPG